MKHNASLHDYLLLSLVLKYTLFETTKKGLINSPEMYGHPFTERLSIYVCFLGTSSLKRGIKKKVYFNLLFIEIFYFELRYFSY